jgi:RNA polymerase subunit RPABC4/transcription elongation factor Spt4
MLLDFLDYLPELESLLQKTDLIKLVLQIFLSYFALLWLSLIIWVTKDVINRSNSLIFQSLSIILNTILPGFGLVIYLLIRPTQSLMDKYYDELEVKLSTSTFFCIKCNEILKKEYVYCPYCSTLNQTECKTCKKLSLITYTYCPYCGKDKKKEIETKNNKKNNKKNK